MGWNHVFLFSFTFFIIAGPALQEDTGMWDHKLKSCVCWLCVGSVL